MNSRPGTPDPHQMLELRALVAGLCDAELTVSQVARLEEMISTSAACAAYYVNAMMVYSALPQYVGVERGASGMQLISNWQLRDNEFWNDVVKTAAALDEHAVSPQVRLAGISLSDTNRHTGAGGLFPRAKSFARRCSERLGLPSQSTWIALLCLLSASFATLVFWVVFSGGDSERVPVANRADGLTAYVARLSKTRQVVWGRGQQPLPGQLLLTAGQRLAIAAGVAEITFDSGAVTIVEGPAEFEVQSAAQGYLHRGRTLSHVPPAARGFAIQTDGVRIVDLGTEFGVDVDEQQNSSVHVLTGLVEAYLPESAAAGAPVRVEANQAIRYDAVTKRLGQVPVDRSRFEQLEDRLTSPVITAVKASSGKPYRIVPGGLREDALAYIDRDYQWNGSGAAGIPAELIGADYVLTSNNDDLDPDFELQVTVGEPATIYVLFDVRAQTPDWLSRDFVNTGTGIGLDTANSPEEFANGPGRSIDVQFSVWKRTVGPGTVVLGPTSQPNVAHYGVAVVSGQR